jgi:hypothetical protein
VEKITKTVSFEDFEEDGSVTYWLNPPSGYVRGLTNALTGVEIPELAPDEKPTTIDQLKAVLDNVANARQVEDAIWSSALKMIPRWTLKGWSDPPTVLPISMEGLDMLEGNERIAVLARLKGALEAVGKLDPKPAALSSNTRPDESAPQEAPSNLREIHANSQSLPESFTG